MHRAERSSPAVVFAVLAVVLIVTLWLAPHISALPMDDLDASQIRSIMQIRYRTMALAVLAGIGLSLAGMTFQGLFRNPLATPFTLGVSSGAMLAKAVALFWGLPELWLFGMGQMGIAFAGALTAVLLVYALARLRREASTSTLLLGGVCLNIICGSGIILIQYLAQEHDAQKLVYWLLGRVTVASTLQWQATQMLLVALLLTTAILWWIHRDLDLLMMGEHMAASRGVEVGRSRAIAYFTASLMTAAVVSMCGPIAFVGLLVPHTMRRFVGPTHALLLPACLLLGAAMLPACDCLARNLLAWTTPNNYLVLPVGVVTGLLGAVFFLMVLIRQRSDRPILA